MAFQLTSQTNEGNPVHPIFSTDEQLEIPHCGMINKVTKLLNNPLKTLTNYENTNTKHTSNG